MYCSLSDEVTKKWSVWVPKQSFHGDGTRLATAFSLQSALEMVKLSVSCRKTWEHGIFTYSAILYTQLMRRGWGWWVGGLSNFCLLENNKHSFNENSHFRRNRPLRSNSSQLDQCILLFCGQRCGGICLCFPHRQPVTNNSLVDRPSLRRVSHLQRGYMQMSNPNLRISHKKCK